MTSRPSEEFPRELVRRAKEGDPQSLNALAKRAYPLVRRWALVRTGDSAEADDLTQDVLVQVIRRLDTFRGSSRFSTWLYSVTRNAAADRARTGARRRARTDEAARGLALDPTPPPSPDATVEAGRTRDILDAFFSRLPERQREVFELSELQGLPSPEVAEILGIEAVSVRAHLFKARRTLRRWILEQHPELVEEMG